MHLLHHKLLLFLFFSFLKERFERPSDREKGRDRSTFHPSTCSFPKCPPQVKLGQAETSSQELPSGLLHGWQNPCTWAVIFCLPGELVGSWIGSRGRTWSQAVWYWVWMPQTAALPAVPWPRCFLKITSKLLMSQGNHEKHAELIISGQSFQLDYPDQFTKSEFRY